MDAAAPRPRVVTTGEAVWRVAHADRAALLVDGASYFSTLRAALAAARHSVFILGWDIDSRTPLVGESGTAEDGAPATLLPYLEHLAERHPELKVRLLLWDYSLLYALDREPLPSLNLKWRTPEQIRVALDDCLPMGSCHHQKLVLIDGNLAFCGGFDLTTGRWDTPEHRPHDPRRRKADGDPCPPWHDVQIMVDGPAARNLYEIACHRWRQVTSEEVETPDVEAAWPKNVEPDLRDIDVGIARTLPENGDQPEVDEIRHLYVASIRAAKRSIYIENQYLTADVVAEALIERLRQEPALEVVAVVPQSPRGWLEARTMGAGQQRFRDRIADAQLAPRVRFFYPWVGDKDTSVMVHAKLMIVDDVLIRVGSSNLNNRSMGADSECDVAIEATTAEHRRDIRALLCRLLGEHLGTGPAQIEDALARGESLISIVDGIPAAEHRGLAPLVSLKTHGEALDEALTLVADPERPLHPEEFIGDMFDARTKESDVRRLVRLGSVAAALLALVLVWTYTPLAQWADPDVLMPALAGARDEWWIYPLLLAAYVIGGLLLFPLTVLLAVTGMMLGPLLGFMTAMICGMVSAWIGYLAGSWTGAEAIRNVTGRTFRRIYRGLQAQGTVTVTALRMVPVAPFTVVNMVMGAAHVRPRAYLAGTALGLVPGVFVMTMVGDRLREMWREPDPMNILWFALVTVLWIGLAFVLQRIVARVRSRKAPE